jgi:hypothetical protein
MRVYCVPLDVIRVRLSFRIGVFVSSLINRQPGTFGCDNSISSFNCSPEAKKK